MDQHPLADSGLKLAAGVWGPVLDVLACVNNRPGKGLPDGDRPHWLCVPRRSGMMFFSLSPLT